MCVKVGLLWSWQKKKSARYSYLKLWVDAHSYSQISKTADRSLYYCLSPCKTDMPGKEAKTRGEIRGTLHVLWRRWQAGKRRRTHLRSVSILKEAILDSSTSTGCQRSMGPQALAQALNGARLSSAWRENTVLAQILMWSWTLKTHPCQFLLQLMTKILCLWVTKRLQLILCDTQFSVDRNAMKFISSKSSFVSAQGSSSSCLIRDSSTPEIMAGECNTLKSWFDLFSSVHFETNYSVNTI